MITKQVDRIVSPLFFKRSNQSWFSCYDNIGCCSGMILQFTYKVLRSLFVHYMFTFSYLALVILLISLCYPFDPLLIICQHMPNAVIDLFVQCQSETLLKVKGCDQVHFTNCRVIGQEDRYRGQMSTHIIVPLWP